MNNKKPTGSKIKLIALSVIISSLLISCSSYKHVTRQIITEYQLDTNDNLERVQYYVDEPFYLIRSEKIIEREIDANLELTRRVHEETLQIDKDTPGVAVKGGEDYIVIDFGEDIFCTFKLVTGIDDDRDKYRLSLINSEDVRYGKFQIKGKKYKVFFPKMEKGKRVIPLLKFHESSTDYSSKDVKKIKGKTLR
ncbi:MAG: hypothetical protein JXR69_03255 [Candidatus Delongbacteria bacterium]|nr:hypothetical protein [Candidatus Delongbacteria bacterium]